MNKESKRTIVRVFTLFLVATLLFSTFVMAEIDSNVAFTHNSTEDLNTTILAKTVNDDLPTVLTLTDRFKLFSTRLKISFLHIGTIISPKYPEAGLFIISSFLIMIYLIHQRYWDYWMFSLMKKKKKKSVLNYHSQLIKYRRIR